MFPKKLYVEVTTRCNMRCGMCVKHVPDSCISNTDMPYGLYTTTRDCLPHLEELVLNGIGEPLLHPDIVRMISFAAQHMKPAGSRGFQTNGMLVTAGKAKELLDAGLNRICISADSLSATGPSPHHLLHSGNVSNPFALFEAARRQTGTELQMGAEVVLTRETLAELPELVRKLGEHGVHFIIGSHLLSYRQDSEPCGLFDTNTERARSLYAKWEFLAREEGVQLSALTGKTWIAPRFSHEHVLKEKYEAMLQEARRENVWLHVKRLEEWDTSITRHAEDIYKEAADVAAAYSIELDLPPLTASPERSCRFMEDKAAFITAEGEVMPCHALWHDYVLYMNGDRKRFHRKAFGSICDDSLLTIWNLPEYADFRNTALRYEFPFCHSCTPGPCPDITGEFGPFVNDCFGLPVPCGHCLWCLDAVRCL